MIIVKTPEQIKLMRIAGRITGEALLLGGEMVKPGVSTKQIDDKIRHYIEKCGAKPSFLGYGGFPGSACISNQSGDNPRHSLISQNHRRGGYR